MRTLTLSERDWERLSLFVTWPGATYSGNGGANCVEAGVAARGRVLVRDTTDRDGAVLDLPADAWDRFTASLRQPANRPRTQRPPAGPPASPPARAPRSQLTRRPLWYHRNPRGT